MQSNDNNLNLNQLNKIFEAKMTEKDFLRLSQFIFNEYGIKMPPAKKIMLQSRLQKRLRELNIPSYKEYTDFVFSKEGQAEIIHMIDVVSTNKTDFFRESTHFDFMISDVLPELHDVVQIRRPIKVWSAGCSSGEEPYTIAIVMNEFAEKRANFDYSIFASDISTIMLEKGATAVYTEDRIAVIPNSLKKKYFLKSKDRNAKTVRIMPLLRHKVQFHRVNFMDNSYNVNDTFDIIFCRNVLIYFDRETQESVINKLCRHLRKDGFFFLGHSESITAINVPLKQIKPTIFRKV